MRSYLRDRQKAIGQAKGGWVAGLEQFGGRVAQWISRHRKFGTVTDKTGHPLVPYWEVENRSRWSSSGDEDRIVANALRQRTSIITQKIEDALQKTSRQTNLS